MGSPDPPADWSDAYADSGTAPMPEAARSEAEMLRRDRGRTLGFSRVVARRLG